MGYAWLEEFLQDLPTRSYVAQESCFALIAIPRLPAASAQPTPPHPPSSLSSILLLKSLPYPRADRSHGYEDVRLPITEQEKRTLAGDFSDW